MQPRPAPANPQETKGNRCTQARLPPCSFPRVRGEGRHRATGRCADTTPSSACGGRPGWGRAPQARVKWRRDQLASTPTRPARHSAPGVRMVRTAVPRKLSAHAHGRLAAAAHPCAAALLLPSRAGEVGMGARAAGAREVARRPVCPHPNPPPHAGEGAPPVVGRDQLASTPTRPRSCPDSAKSDPRPAGRGGRPKSGLLALQEGETSPGREKQKKWAGSLRCPPAPRGGGVDRCFYQLS